MMSISVLYFYGPAAAGAVALLWALACMLAQAAPLAWDLAGEKWRRRALRLAARWLRRAARELLGLALGLEALCQSGDAVGASEESPEERVRMAEAFSRAASHELRQAVQACDDDTNPEPLQALADKAAVLWSDCALWQKAGAD